MDPISDILAHLDFSGMLYFSTEFSGPWGVRVPAYENVIRFHLAMRGRCHVRVAGSQVAQVLAPGDFILVPHGQSHDLLSHENAPAPALETVLRDTGYPGYGPLVCQLDDQGEETRLLCGHFSYDTPKGGQGLLRGLPNHILARGMPGSTRDWLRATLSLLADESQARQPGHDAILRRMTEILFIQALRQWMADDDLPQGVLKGLGDRNLSAAFSAVHADPRTPWTVAAMARTAGLSRSVFAQRFHELTGTTPLRYLTEWRLQKAHRLLLQGRLSVDEIADTVGYRSTPAFARVYARHFGEGPGRTRRGGARAAA